jgi:hypothetical protein
MQSVQVFVVRKGSRSVFGDRSGPPCTTLGKSLSAQSPGKKPVSPGVHRVRTVYSSSSKSVRENLLLASARWERKDASGDQDYRLLVPDDAEFYMSGFRYCLFVETSKQKIMTSEGPLMAAIETLAAACPPPSSADNGAERGVCEIQALTAFEEAIDQEAAKVVGSGRGPEDVAVKSKELRAAAREMFGPVDGFSRANKRLDEFTDPTKRVSPELNFSAWGDVGTGVAPAAVAAGSGLNVDRMNHLAHAVATLLAWNRGLLLFPPAGKTGFFHGALPIQSLRINADGKTIEVASVKSPQEKKGTHPENRQDMQISKIDVTTDKLEVVSGITLYDLMLLLRNRVVVGKKDYTLSGLAGAIKAAASDGWNANTTTLTSDAYQKVAALADALASMQKLAQEASVKPSELLDDTPSAVQVHLSAVMMTARASLVLEDFAQTLNLLHRSRTEWDAGKSKLTVVTRGLASFEVAALGSTQIEFSEKDWVFTYVTPVIGYAQLRTDGNFALFYIAAQLHFVPNRGDDVLWSNGFRRDIWRAFALELGFSPDISRFGPDDRLAGYSGFPPAYIGAAIHVIPYTSFSFGGVLLDRKSSSLTDERAELTVKPYIGFNVQFNIPEYVREASKPATSTKVTTQSPRI